LEVVVERLAEEVVRVALDAFFEGCSVRASALRAGICRTTLTRRLDELGVSHAKVPGQTRIRDSIVAPAVALWRAGVSVDDAAASVGVSERTLRDRINSETGPVNIRHPRPGSLTLSDREEIRVGISHGQTDTQIAGRLGRHRSTIWREISLNGGRLNYRIAQAHERACDRIARPKPGWTCTRPNLWIEVQRLLREEKWSPQQISERIRRDHDNNADWCVSHEAIYQGIYAQTSGQLRRELIACLRQARPNRQRQRRAVSQGTIKNMINIAQRPPEAADRSNCGNLEGDLICGIENKSAVVTLIDRHTRFAFLIKLENKTAAHVAERISAVLAQQPAMFRKTLTWDQGSELAAHTQITENTGTPIYFCDPHSPWQRPTNENFNGLARQFLPKHTDLSGYTQKDLDKIANLLNNRPRRVLAWDTPRERYDQLVATTT
jgi:transposase, IS30 family